MNQQTLTNKVIKLDNQNSNNSINKTRKHDKQQNNSINKTKQIKYNLTNLLKLKGLKTRP